MTSQNRFRLQWSCRRGIKELDLLLQPFFEQHYDNLDENEQQVFAQLLEYHDTDILAWFMQQRSPEDPKIKELVEKISAYHKQSISVGS